VWPEELEAIEPPAESGEAGPAEEPVGPGPLLFPVAGGRQTGLEKHFLSRRGRRLHHAVDIVAPRNTPIRAVADGTIVRLHRSRRGGIGVEQVDASGEYCFYYAHLQRYAPGLKVGQSVSRDDLLGFVGSTGRAAGPHLHFQVMKLDANGDCWLGSTPIDPYPLLELRRAAPFQPGEPRLEAE
jgi:murein DD-endopeptidase MepM/ murein hydrolase activator NlpD